MHCPYCGNALTQVRDSRPVDDSSAVRRRRECSDCGGRFTTFERVQLRELTVMKKSGKREVFDRDKLTRSIMVALRKRNMNREQTECMITGIIKQLESLGEGHIPTETIGLLAMKSLKAVDDVAYVRFASVYRDFHRAKDFVRLLKQLNRNEDGI